MPTASVRRPCRSSTSFHNDNHDIDGNPDLKAEYSNNVTGSFTYRILHNARIRLTTTLSGFYNVFKDKISLAQNVDIPNYNTYYNIGRYKTLGGALETSLAWGGLRVNVNASLIGRYNKYASDDKSLPQFRYSPEVSTTISYHIAKSGTDISFFYKYTGQRKEYYYHEYTTPDNKKESEIYLRGLLLPLQGHHRHAEADLVPEPERRCQKPLQPDRHTHDRRIRERHPFGQLSRLRTQLLHRTELDAERKIQKITNSILTN